MPDFMAVRIAFDVGTVRIGVATSDPHGILASPQEVIAAGEDSIAEAMRIIAKHEAVEIYVGLPRTLTGGESDSTRMARDWARQLEEKSSGQVILIDERLTTVQAQSAFRRAGKNTKQSRSGIDSAAAAVLLQGVLDSQPTN